MGFLNSEGLAYFWGKIKALVDTKANASHTHNYAGSSSAGGSATSAVKLTTSAGSAVRPVYFSGGKPVAGTYTLGSIVTKNSGDYALASHKHSYSDITDETIDIDGGTP